VVVEVVVVEVVEGLLLEGVEVEVCTRLIAALVC
jgi:hypothetical protein